MEAIRNIVITGKGILFIILSIVFIGCTGDRSAKPKSSGKTAEMLIVTDTDPLWEGPFGEAFREFFAEDYPALNQSEPFYEFGHIPINNFNDARMFKSHHNIMIAAVDDEYTRPFIDIRKDVWAKPQTVVRVIAPDVQGLTNLFNENKAGILEAFRKQDRERLENTFAAFRDRSVIGEVEKGFNLFMEIPSGFYVAKNMAGFMWIRKETDNNSQGIIISSYDYTDTAAFTQARIISYRNAITKEYIPGPSEGSYMTVDASYIYPINAEIDFNGIYAVETRGLWSVEGDFMGGPFVSYTFVDEKRNKVITVDGYIFAPNKPKRDLLIQMEAIINSLRFTE